MIIKHLGIVNDDNNNNNNESSQRFDEIDELINQVEAFQLCDEIVVTPRRRTKRRFLIEKLFGIPRQWLMAATDKTSRGLETPSTDDYFVKE